MKQLLWETLSDFRMEWFFLIILFGLWVRKRNLPKKDFRKRFHSAWSFVHWREGKYPKYEVFWKETVFSRNSFVKFLLNIQNLTIKPWSKIIHETFRLRRSIMRIDAWGFRPGLLFLSLNEILSKSFPNTRRLFFFLPSEEVGKTCFVLVSWASKAGSARSIGLKIEFKKWAHHAFVYQILLELGLIVNELCSMKDD